LSSLSGSGSLSCLWIRIWHIAKTEWQATTGYTAAWHQMKTSNLHKHNFKNSSLCSIRILDPDPAFFVLGPDPDPWIRILIGIRWPPFQTPFPLHNIPHQLSSCGGKVWIPT
jgi:hypothetical protein